MKKIIFLLLLFSVTVADAQNWKDVGGGLDIDAYCLYTDTFRHVLYAGGDFDYAGGIYCPKMAKWDGVSWSQMGGFADYMHSIAADSNYVYVTTGSLGSEVSRCNNSGIWSPMPPLFSSQVNKIAVVNGELYAGGDFLYSGSTLVNHIAKWNGAGWDSLGPGVGESPAFSTLYAITEYQGHLVVGGNFKLSGSDTMNNLAMWDGSSWHSIGGGLPSTTLFNNSDVYDLFADGNNLYVAGNFQYAGAVGGLTVNSIAMWDGTSWHNFGNGAFVNGLTGSVLQVLKRGNELFAIGDFSNNHRLVKWNGANWNSYFDNELYGQGECMAYYNNEFYVRGGFITDVNNQVLNYVARRAKFGLANDTVSCNNNCNGIAEAPLLGVAPDNYVWSNGASTQSIGGLCVGNYYVTVTDSTGSQSIGTVTVSNPPGIIINNTTTNASCQTCNNGTATVTVSGGIPPYSFIWSNGETTNTVDSLLAGVYYLTLTDNNGCQKTDTFEVSVDVGVEQLIIYHFRLIVYPNPVTSIATIEYQTTQSGKSTVKVENCLGQIIQSTEITNNKKQNIDMSNCANGMYFIKCFDGNQQTKIKVVKN